MLPTLLQANRLLEFHVEGDVPARLSAEDTHLIGLCTQPRARDRAASAVPKNGLPTRSGVGGMVRSPLDVSISRRTGWSKAEAEQAASA